MSRIDPLELDETARSKLSESWRQKIQRANEGEQG